MASSVIVAFGVVSTAAMIVVASRSWQQEHGAARRRRRLAGMATRRGPIAVSAGPGIGNASLALQTPRSGKEAQLARWLASADLYASAMADETFGISIIEAQASGLPVVGVASGAMVDRVTRDIGRIGPVDDAAAMARNLCEIWLGEPAAMGDASWRHAQQFSWRESMQTLFGDLYPRALAQAMDRAASSAAVRSSWVRA